MKVFQGLERIPHKGAMCLIERVVETSADRIHCIARDHTDHDYPLRLDGTLFAATLVELGAQAAAVHTSLHTIADNHVGLLVGLRDVNISVLTIDNVDDRLEVHADQLHVDPGVALYGFCVRCNGNDVVTGKAMLKMKGVRK